MLFTLFINSLIVEAPVLSGNSTTATSMSISWTSLGSYVESYEVMWQRDTSGECSDENEGSISLTGGSTSYDIVGLEEDSSYNITVTANNGAGGSTVSNTITTMTLEAGEGCPYALCQVELLLCIQHHLLLLLL